MQGFGKKPSLGGGYVYPGSGATCDTEPSLVQQPPSAELEQKSEPAANGQLESAQDFGDAPPDDPNVEFQTLPGHHPPSEGPRIINVGIPGPGKNPSDGLVCQGKRARVFLLTSRQEEQR